MRIHKKQKGIQWTLTTQLEDLDFANDVCFRSHRHQNAQQKPTTLSKVVQKTGLTINTKKTVLMRINHTQKASVKLGNQDIPESENVCTLAALSVKMGQQTWTSRAASAKQGMP